MHYQGTIIRPPSEGGSILLQVAAGCSHNKCTFCGAYKGERFKLIDLDAVLEDIVYAAGHFKGQRRLFLCGGDALIMPTERLLGILAEIREKLPWVTRVGSYGNAKAVAFKSDEEMIALKEAGLGIIYMGLESGDDETLKAVCKHGDSDEIVRQGQRVKDAGMQLSVTVLLGLAGKARSLEHARATGEAITRMQPHHASALTLMVMENTPLFDDLESGVFELPDAQGMLRELREMLAATNLERGLFLCNHGSNYLPLKVRMPSGKQAALDKIDAALAGEVPLKEEHLRAL